MTGIDLKNIKTEKPTKKDKEEKDLLAFLNKDLSFGSFVNDKYKESLYSELAILLEAGVDIRSSLEIIQKEQTKEKSQKFLTEVQEQIIQGKTLSEVLENSGHFSSYEFYSIKIGEETGKLTYVLNELATYFHKKIKQKRQVMNALSYPILVFATSIGAVFFMLYFVVPMFSDIFKRSGNDLPVITQWIIDASTFVSDYALFIFLGIAVIVGGLFSQRNKEWFQKYSAMILLKIPFVGNMIHKIELTRFCLILALLISSKIPLVQSLDLMRKMISFYPIKSVLTSIEQSILLGNSLHKSLEEYPIFPTRMMSLIKVGEEVNKLDTFFEKIASQYNDEVEHNTSILGNVIEPLILIFLGIVVGTILVAMYLPMFSMSSNFGH